MSCFINSPFELNKLGAAAKDVSAVLGRDVTDSFNRLVRGVTKAEPELLDELGIILRLDDASDAYAQQLGITAEKLTRIEFGETLVKQLTNLKQVRVRDFDGSAKIEVDKKTASDFQTSSTRNAKRIFDERKPLFFGQTIFVESDRTPSAAQSDFEA